MQGREDKIVRAASLTRTQQDMSPKRSQDVAKRTSSQNESSSVRVKIDAWTNLRYGYGEQVNLVAQVLDAKDERGMLAELNYRMTDGNIEKLISFLSTQEPSPRLLYMLLECTVFQKQITRKSAGTKEVINANRFSKFLRSSSLKDMHDYLQNPAITEFAVRWRDGVLQKYNTIVQIFQNAVKSINFNYEEDLCFMSIVIEILNGYQTPSPSLGQFKYSLNLLIESPLARDFIKKVAKDEVRNILSPDQLAACQVEKKANKFVPFLQEFRGFIEKETASNILTTLCSGLQSKKLKERDYRQFVAGVFKVFGDVLAAEMPVPAFLSLVQNWSDKDESLPNFLQNFRIDDIAQWDWKDQNFSDIRKILAAAIATRDKLQFDDESTRTRLFFYLSFEPSAANYSSVESRAIRQKIVASTTTVIPIQMFVEGENWACATLFSIELHDGIWSAERIEGSLSVVESIVAEQLARNHSTWCAALRKVCSTATDLRFPGDNKTNVSNLVRALISGFFRTDAHPPFSEPFWTTRLEKVEKGDLSNVIFKNIYASASIILPLLVNAESVVAVDPSKPVWLQEVFEHSETTKEPRWKAVAQKVVDKFLVLRKGDSERVISDKLLLEEVQLLTSADIWYHINASLKFLGLDLMTVSMEITRAKNMIKQWNDLGTQATKLAECRARLKSALELSDHGRGGNFRTINEAKLGVDQLQKELGGPIVHFLAKLRDDGETSPLFELMLIERIRAIKSEGRVSEGIKLSDLGDAVAQDMLEQFGTDALLSNLRNVENQVKRQVTQVDYVLMREAFKDKIMDQAGLEKALIADQIRRNVARPDDEKDRRITFLDRLFDTISRDPLDERLIEIKKIRDALSRFENRIAQSAKIHEAVDALTELASLEPDHKFWVLFTKLIVLGQPNRGLEDFLSLLGTTERDVSLKLSMMAGAKMLEDRVEKLLSGLAGAFRLFELGKGRFPPNTFLSECKLLFTSLEGIELAVKNYEEAKALHERMHDVVDTADLVCIFVDASGDCVAKLGDDLPTPCAAFLQQLRFIQGGLEKEDNTTSDSARDDVDFKIRIIEAALETFNEYKKMLRLPYPLPEAMVRDGQVYLYSAPGWTPASQHQSVPATPRSVPRQRSSPTAFSVKQTRAPPPLPLNKPTIKSPQMPPRANAATTPGSLSLSPSLPGSENPLFGDLSPNVGQAQRGPPIPSRLSILVHETSTSSSHSSQDAGESSKGHSIASNTSYGSNQEDSFVGNDSFLGVLSVPDDSATDGGRSMESGRAMESTKNQNRVWESERNRQKLRVLKNLRLDYYRDVMEKRTEQIFKQAARECFGGDFDAELFDTVLSELSVDTRPTFCSKGENFVELVRVLNGRLEQRALQRTKQMTDELRAARERFHDCLKLELAEEPRLSFLSSAQLRNVLDSSDPLEMLNDLSVLWELEK